jgi:hypothetical protein
LRYRRRRCRHAGRAAMCCVPPRARRHCSYLVGRSPRQASKRDTARMAASTQGSRKFASRFWNIS